MWQDKIEKWKDKVRLMAKLATGRKNEVEETMGNRDSARITSTKLKALKTSRNLPEFVKETYEAHKGKRPAKKCKHDIVGKEITSAKLSHVRLKALSANYKQ